MTTTACITATGALVRELQDLNPTANVTEPRVRHVLRCGYCPAPPVVGGRYLWTAEHVRRLAEALGVHPPAWARS
jgi:hypothetical protein